MADHEENEGTYPRDLNAYTYIGEALVSGAYSIVYQALCEPKQTLVACKRIDLDNLLRDRQDAFQRGAKIMSELHHPNILKSHLSFAAGSELWVIMPFVLTGSLQSIMSKIFKDGLPEDYIAVILKEVLKALAFLHGKGHVHKGVKAGNIFLDQDGSVKLSDTGISSARYEVLQGYVLGTYWRAPEMRMNQDKEFSFKTDIWSFGITALELAHGKPPLSLARPYRSVLSNMTKLFRISDYLENNPDLLLKDFSKSFMQMVKSCLDPCPAKRPTAEKLLTQNPFFAKPNLPTFYEIFSHINHEMGESAVLYPFSSPAAAAAAAIVQQKSQTTKAVAVVDNGTSEPCKGLSSLAERVGLVEKKSKVLEGQGSASVGTEAKVKVEAKLKEEVILVKEEEGQIQVAAQTIGPMASDNDTSVEGQGILEEAMEKTVDLLQENTELAMKLETAKKMYYDLVIDLKNMELQKSATSCSDSNKP